VDQSCINLGEIGWGGEDCIDPTQGQGPVEGSCEHNNKPLGSVKCWEVLEQLHNEILRRPQLQGVSYLNELFFRGNVHVLSVIDLEEHVLPPTRVLTFTSESVFQLGL
jgi:hypothetical protein